MKKVILTIIAVLLTASFAWAEPMVINHESVDLIDEIPQEYVDIIKTKLFNSLGQSHNAGLYLGLERLAEMQGYQRFAVQATFQDDMYSPTNQNLRATPARIRAIGSTSHRRDTGEEHFWVDSNPYDLQNEAYDLITEHLSYQSNSGNPAHYMGLGWCYEMTKNNDPGGEEDDVYDVRWAGRSFDLDGDNGRWGLDEEDSQYLGNPVNMDMYLDAIESYIQYAQDEGLETKVFFSTGPVDGSTNKGENGYQRSIKNQYIRDFIDNSGEDYCLFDYADILTYGNNGNQNTEGWNGNTYPYIHDDYNEAYGEDTIAHINMDGCVKLAKALWVMMAKLEGWNPSGNEPQTEYSGVINEASFIDPSVSKGDPLILTVEYEHQGDETADVELSLDYCRANGELLKAKAKTRTVNIAVGETIRLEGLHLPTGFAAKNDYIIRVNAAAEGQDIDTVGLPVTIK